MQCYSHTAVGTYCALCTLCRPINANLQVLQEERIAWIKKETKIQEGQLAYKKSAIYYSGKLNGKKSQNAFWGFIKGWASVKLARCESEWFCPSDWTSPYYMLNNIPDLYYFSSLHLHQCIAHYVALLTEMRWKILLLNFSSINKQLF